jgi:tetraacyldisaccharide 4'-kinase
VIRHDFPDHHVFVENDLLFHDGLPVIMTEKDAIKCREFRLQNCWYIPITVELTEAFHHRLTQLLKDVFNG